MEIVFEYSKLKFPLRVNPFDESIWLPKGKLVKHYGWVGKSKYVEGKRFSDLIDSFDEKDIKFTFNYLDYELDRRLGIIGVNLTMMNIKVVEEMGQKTFVITDLCADISKLHPAQDQ